MTGISADGFDIGDEVGRGGFGVVYRARQIELNRTVAGALGLRRPVLGRGPLHRIRTTPGAPAVLPPGPVTVVTVTDPNGAVVVRSSTRRAAASSAPRPRSTPTAARTTARAPAVSSPYPTPTLDGGGHCTATGAIGTIDVAKVCPGWTSDWRPGVGADYYPCFEQVGFSSTNLNSSNDGDPSCDGSYWRVTASPATTTTYRYRLRLYYLKSGRYVKGALSAQTDTVTITFR